MILWYFDCCIYTEIKCIYYIGFRGLEVSCRDVGFCGYFLLGSLGIFRKPKCRHCAVCACVGVLRRHR